MSFVIMTLNPNVCEHISLNPNSNIHPLEMKLLLFDGYLFIYLFIVNPIKAKLKAIFDCIDGQM